MLPGIRLRVASGIGGLLAALSSLGGGQVPAARALSEREMQAVAEKLVARRAAIAKVWPGFWQPPAFAMYLRDSVAYLYTEREVPAGYVALASAGAPSGLSGRWYRRAGGIPGLRGGILPVDPRAHPLALAVDAGGAWVDPFLEVMLHESFHGFQLRHFEPEPDSVPAQLSEADVGAAEVQSRLARERQLGLEVLRTTEPTGRRTRLSEYLAVRAVRGITGTAVMVEKRYERWEGVATYVGLTGLLVAEGLDRASFSDSLAARMSVEWRWGLGAPAAAAMRTRAYLSGALLAFLLDEFECTDWKAGVQGGAYLDDLLARCVGKRK